MKKVHEYIIDRWKNTVRSEKIEDGRINLPYPFSVPCESEMYTSFFYWDTYFINRGLIFDDPSQARNNLLNMKYMIEQIGYVPNSNLQCMLNRSQPPLFAEAVQDFCEVTGDFNMARECFSAIEKETAFWESRRKSEIGLNFYRVDADEASLEEFLGLLKERGIVEKDKTSLKIAEEYYTEAESGWDFTSRFESRGLQYIPLDLNCILYKREVLLSKYAGCFGDEEKRRRYKEAAERRRGLIEKYLFDGETGFYRDYNYVENKFSPVISTASFMPFWAGINTDPKLCAAVLQKLEFENGVSATEKIAANGIKQWDYPNMWPPLVYFAFKALQAVGLQEECRRIAKKYMNTVERTFEESGSLWEKYSALSGGKSTWNEYESPRMLGWTAGVYENFYYEMLRLEKQ